MPWNPVPMTNNQINGRTMLLTSRPRWRSMRLRSRATMAAIARLTRHPRRSLGGPLGDN